ncbi:MAG: hypothetical protein SGJ24_15785 [Chloroflexota bacterium]|nr:hypothetical protein [Chloroflexota bacterium]
MPYSIEIIEHSTIIITLTRYIGDVTSEDFTAWNAELDTAIASPNPESVMRFYNILDVTATGNVDFSTVMEQMRVAPDQIDAPGGSPDTFKLMFVGDAPMAKLAVDLARRKSFYGGQTVPMFRTLDDAMAFITIDRTMVGAATATLASPGSPQPADR